MSPSSATSSRSSARNFAASAAPSMRVAAKLGNGQLDVADVEPERLGDPDSDLDVLLQGLDVTRAHRAGVERALLRPPERMLDEGRQEPVRGLDELALRLLVRVLQEHL